MAPSPYSLNSIFFNNFIFLFFPHGKQCETNGRSSSVNGVAPAGSFCLCRVSFAHPPPTPGLSNFCVPCASYEHLQSCQELSLGYLWKLYSNISFFIALSPLLLLTHSCSPNTTVKSSEIQVFSLPHKLLDTCKLSLLGYLSHIWQALLLQCLHTVKKTQANTGVGPHSWLVVYPSPILLSVQCGATQYFLLWCPPPHF